MSRRLIYDDRQTGKTTGLIRWAREESPSPAPMRYIITPNRQRVQNVWRMAMDLGGEDNGPGMSQPVFWDEAVAMGGHGRFRDVEFAVDDLDAIVDRVLFSRLPGPVVMATWNYDSRSEP